MINGRYDLEHERNTEKHSINKGQRTIEWKKGLKYSSPTCFRNKRDSSTDPNASMSYFLFPSSFWREFRIFWIRSSIRYNLDQRNVYIYIYIHPVSSIFRQRSFRWNIDGKQAGLKQSFKQFDSLRNRNRLRSIRTLLNKRFLKVIFEKLIFNDLEAWINIWKISLSELKYVLWNAWNISKLY